MRLSPILPAVLVLISILAVLAPAAGRAAVSGTFAPQSLPTENAFYLRATGNGRASNALTWQEFKSNVEQAAIRGRGGVINFEDSSDRPNITLIRPQINNVLGFEMKGDSFGLRRSDSFGTRDDLGLFPSGVYVMSGVPAIGPEFRLRGFDFSVEDASLSEVGFVLLGDVWTNMLRAEITATFSGGGSVTLDSGLPDSVFADRYFYGFKAPQGESITSINSNFGATRIVLMDDFGFVAVPEPATGLAALLTIGIAMALSRRRWERGPAAATV